MDNKRTIVDFISYVMKIFGICISVISVITLLSNEEISEFGLMFQYGNQAVSVVVLLQFLLISVITTVLVFVFTSEYMIKRSSLIVRLILMPVSIIICSGISIYCFGWFPSGEALPWIMFVVSFLICFGISVFITCRKNKESDDELNKVLREMK